MKTFKYLLGTLAMAGAMVACSPEEFPGMDEGGLVAVSQYKDLFKLENVDQSINQVTVKFNGAAGVYPVWELHLADGKVEYSTAASLSRVIALEGDYFVRCYVGNKSGISSDYVDLPFHINESIIDYTKYYTLISKGTWYMDNNAEGHIACGPSATDPTSWWKAGKDEKADFGVYDNALTFSADNVYTFDPGAAGTIYANKCVTLLPAEDKSADFTTPAEATTAHFEFKMEGEDLYLVLDSKVPFPYIASDQIYENPRYLVHDITAKSMTLWSYQTTNDNPDGIGWQYILTTQHEVKEVFNGFTYDQANNIWKNIEVQAGGIYYADAGWAPYPDNGGATFEVTNAEAKVVLPLATAAQWQAQFPIHTNVGPGSEFMTSAKNYDFSCVITSNKDLNGMTLKLVETGDNGVPGSNGIAYDANAVFYDNSTNLKAFEDYVFYLVDQPGVDIQDHVLQLVLDFGGCDAETEVTVKNIVLIEHALNTELDKVPGQGGDTPGEDPSKPSVDWSGENLLAGMPVNITQYYAPGWNKIADAEYTAENDVYTITYNEAASDQWMAQFTFNNTGVALDPAKTYDFRVKLTSTNDHPGVTVKLTQQDDDDTYITADRHALAAYEEVWVELSDLAFVVVPDKGKGVITDLKMPFDFGGVAAGTVITISEMHLQEHKAAAGPAEVDWTKPNLLASMPVDLTQYYAPGWNKIADAEYTAENGVYTINYPSATSERWQAQFTFNETGIALDPEKSYDLRVKLTSSTDLKGATVKFTQQDDDNTFITEDRHDLEAYEEKDIKLTDLKFIVNGEGKGVINNLKIVFDFGGNAENTEITISEMHLQEH